MYRVRTSIHGVVWVVGEHNGAEWHQRAALCPQDTTAQATDEARAGYSYGGHVGLPGYADMRRPGTHALTCAGPSSSSVRSKQVSVSPCAPGRRAHGAQGVRTRPTATDCV